MSYRVAFSPEAEEQLAALYGYIAAAASPDIAARYTEAKRRFQPWINDSRSMRASCFIISWRCARWRDSSSH